MKKILLVVSLVFAFSASAAQAQITLLDQIGPDPTGINGQNADASQRFEAANSAFHVISGQNFVVPAGSPVSLSHVSVVLTAFNTATGLASFAAIQNYELQIYSTVTAPATNLTGDVSSTIVPTANATQTVPFGTNAGTNFGPSGLIDLNVSSFNITLNPGTYFFGIMPRMDFTGNGQMGVSLTTFGGGAGDGFQANPGGGFALPGNESLNVGNFAYRVTATAVPEPTSMALVGIGLAGFGWRRFRKR
jgi:opacity protein-like surface antigen